MGFGTNQQDIINNIVSFYYGLDGDDDLSGSPNISNIIYGGEGNDVVRGRAYNTSIGNGTQFSPFSNGFDNSDPADNDILYGDGGRDLVYGAGGDDVIYGGEGDDGGTVPVGNAYVQAGLYGGNGNDYVDGGRGDDAIEGGEGMDRIYGGEGADSLKGGGGSDILAGGDEFDFLSGDAGNDIVYGGDGNDISSGGDGSDKFFGGDGNDTLYGDFGGFFQPSATAGNDVIYGENGNDSINGEFGKDQMYGGNDADKFIFNSVTESAKGAGRDIIKDFSHAEKDKIDLSVIDANTKKSLDQKFTWIDTGPFTKVAGQLHEIQFANKTLVEGDTNGDGKADFQIEVTGHINLVKGDFIL